MSAQELRRLAATVERIDAAPPQVPAYMVQGLDNDLVHALEQGEITLRRAKVRQEERNARRVWIGTKGATAIVNGERGTVVLIQHLTPTWVGVCIRLDDRPVILYVEGCYVEPDRQHMDLHSAREVTDRDEFDRITGLDEARRGMGWTF